MTLVHPSPERLAGGAPTVAVVDDDRAIRMLVAHALTGELGLRVECLSDGYEAIRWLEQGQPDLLLLDMVMPVVDGLAVLRWLRAHPPPHRMPVVAFTAAGMPALDTLRACGADDAIAKPFDLDRLLEAVGHHLERSESA